MLLLPALSHAVIEEWRVPKLTVIDKLKINDLILLLSSTDGPFLMYMHVFRIIQNVPLDNVFDLLHFANILTLLTTYSFSIPMKSRGCTTVTTSSAALPTSILVPLKLQEARLNLPRAACHPQPHENSAPCWPNPELV